MTPSTLENMATRYIEKTERVFAELRKAQQPYRVDGESVIRVIEEAGRYLEDAKHYLNRKRFETSLASIAYCEGLLDGLRMLGFIEFKW